MCRKILTLAVATTAIISATIGVVRADTVSVIYTAAQATSGQPRSLTHDQYTSLFAYILQQNGYPAGSTPLAYNASLTSTVPLVSQIK